MFLIATIAIALATVVLSAIAFSGINHYSENAPLDDAVEAEKTASDLKKIVIVLTIVIIASLGIMSFSHYTERTNVQLVEREKT